MSMPFISLCPSYLPVYAEVQEPYAYLQSSQVQVTNLYLGMPAKATITLINGTLLPTRFHWGKVRGPMLREPGLQPSEALVKEEVGPRHLPEQIPSQPGTLGSCRAQHAWPGFALSGLQEFQFPAREGVSGPPARPPSQRRP